jgi:riboflavin biosynthesis pyrimidine reductase
VAGLILTGRFARHEGRFDPGQRVANVIMPGGLAILTVTGVALTTLHGGGANVVQQYLAAGLVDEFELHIVPILLGGGARLLENVGDLKLEQVRAIEAPGVTHIKYRVVR